MEQIIVEGGNRLSGEISVSGMKNSALPIIFSCILVKGDSVLDNIPRVSDVENALEILRSMGAKAEFCGLHTVLINTDNLTNNIGSAYLVSKMRASSYLLGTMLSRFGSVELPMPGGCNFGSRPIDIHLKGFESLGAVCEVYDGAVSVRSNKKVNYAKITLDKISVGATINMVLASVLRDGVTVIENCAKEPHVDDLIAFLTKCGAKLCRYNSSIVCCGVTRLCGTRYTIFPDMIEALTYAMCVGICKGNIYVKCVNPAHLTYVIDILRKMAFGINVYTDCISVSAEEIIGADVETLPYPMFPTDLHPQFSALLSFANGGGSVCDNVFPTRFAYVDELKKMGAEIEMAGNKVFIKQAKLKGAVLDATDLRAGAALVLAGLGAEGQSTINNVEYIVRGYENMVDKIALIGGKIKLTKETNHGSN